MGSVRSRAFRVALSQLSYRRARTAFRSFKTESYLLRFGTLRLRVLLLGYAGFDLSGSLTEVRVSP
jgi:hypothetical protein